MRGARRLRRAVAAAACAAALAPGATASTASTTSTTSTAATARDGAAATSEAVAAPLTPEQRAAAIAELDRRIAGCEVPDRCLAIVVDVALFKEKPGTPLQQVAEERVVVNMQVAKDELFRLHKSSPPAVQARIYRLLDAGWDHMHHGVDFYIVNLVGRGVTSPSPEVRRAAATLASRRPLRRIGNTMVDATEDDPALRPYALRAIEVAGDELVARWVVAQVGAADPGVDALARRALAAIGREGLTAVQERLASADPRERRQGVRALLAIAAPVDTPSFEAWLADDGAGDPELAEQVTRALAELEVGRYRFKMPDVPPLP